MEEIRREPVELTEAELDAVAGGTFDLNGHATALVQQQINVGQVGVTAVASLIDIG